ncbi:MAG: prephenate dehydrogenase/arogenate dehydrogenase family protein [Candidatus Omnitrophica bacterium]|nr:prephenate dehydrogenase/arogenate dehydrogenase family protein [Candidatus Omnitrophota bacterium]MCM8802853.1 prephenate dehydrogenase/arogenate dehydrogenase family protein [Candidatus Omnitrophota bacterium]
MFEFKKIGVIGIGVIGGSICIDLKKKKIVEKVIGYSRKLETMEKALRNGIIDYYYKKPEDLIKDVDFLILATPINVMNLYFQLIKNINPKIFFTDVASVKKIVCEQVRKIIGENSNFIGSHPISGSEKSGINNIKEGLFENKTVVITPTEKTNEIVKEKVKKLWTNLGSKVFEMTPEQHDKIFAFTSHLPHFLVYSLLSVGHRNRKISKEYFGSGFFDTTRIGKSNPELWTDIFLYNKKNILFWTKKFEKEFKKVKKFLENDDKRKLEKFLTKVKKYRENLE